MTRRPTRRARGAQPDGLTGDLFAGLDDEAAGMKGLPGDAAPGVGDEADSDQPACIVRNAVPGTVPPPRTPAQMLTLLDAWQTQGMLRYIDVALARFLAQEVLPGGEPDPEAAGALALVLLGAALCSAQLGQGHACLDLQAVTADPAGIPGLPVADALHGLDALRWQAALRVWPQLVSCPAQAGDACTGRFTPLVLAHGRLYLHRLWRCEQDVQQGILQRLGREDVALSLIHI